MRQPRLPSMGGLLLVSLLVMLNLPLIFTGFTGMDQYGFFTVDLLADRPAPLILSAAANTGAAAAAYAVYRLLDKRRPVSASHISALGRVMACYALLFGAPVGLATLPSLLLGSYGIKPYFFLAGVIIAGSLAVVAALKDGEIRPHPQMARYWPIIASIALLLLQAIWVAGMLALYYVNQIAATGNFLWTWDFSWSGLGYLPQEFNQRRLDAFLVISIAGAVYMALILSGVGLDLLLRRATAAQHRQSPRPMAAPTLSRPVAAEPPETGGPDEQPTPDWHEVVLDALATVQANALEEPAFIASLSGREIVIGSSQYEGLLADKERLLPEAALLVDQASGTAFAKDGESWNRIAFRGRRNGPFLLLCIYARHPGRRFTGGELESLLRMELPDRSDLNVSDFINQLQKRKAPSIPVERNADGSCLPDTVNVCFLARLPEHPANGLDHLG